MNIAVREIQVKNIITKSNLPIGDFSVNPYVGCTHSCKYCYACFMKRFTNHAVKNFKNVRVGFSINTLDENFKNDMDNAVSISRRINAVKDFCNLIWLENLNLRGEYKPVILLELDRKIKNYCENIGLDYFYNTDDLHRDFSESPAVINYFFHEKIKKSARLNKNFA